MCAYRLVPMCAVLLLGAACVGLSGAGTEPAPSDAAQAAPPAHASGASGTATGTVGGTNGGTTSHLPSVLSEVHTTTCTVATTGAAFVPQPGVTYVLTADLHAGLQIDGNSVAAGAMLAQGPVTFTMDQLFTFETYDANHLQLRAYHSGKTLSVDGNGSITQSDANDLSSRWRVVMGDGNRYAFVQDATSSCLTLPDGNQTLHIVAHKKGWSGWDGNWFQVAKTFRPTWLYDWGTGGDPSTQPAGVEYVPMVWGYYGDANGLKSYLAAADADPNVKHVLAYNEPDNAGQANLDVNTAIATWPWFTGMGKSVGSPAGTQATGPWMTTFMAAVHNNVSFVTVHWYGGTSAASLQSYLQAVYAAYQRPIWITEFAPADWNSGNVNQINFAQQDVTTFMAQVIPMLDSLPYVQRYAWFEANPTDAALGRSTLRNADGSLTGAGQIYANYPFVP